LFAVILPAAQFTLRETRVADAWPRFTAANSKATSSHCQAISLQLQLSPETPISLVDNSTPHSVRHCCDKI